MVLSLGGYWLYSENQTLKSNNIKLEGAVAEQKAAIVAIYWCICWRTSK